MTSRSYLLLICALITASCGRTQDGMSKADRERLNRLEGYCAGLRGGLQLAARTLDDPEVPDKIRHLQEDAFGGGGHIVPIEAQVHVCTGGPETWPELDGCWMRQDDKCLARLAKAAAASVDASIHEMDKAR